jgi:hypothetical protein
VNITGAELKALIPDDIRLSLDQIAFFSQEGETEPYVFLSLDSEHGPLTVLAFRKEAARLVSRNATVSSRKSTDVVAAAAAAAPRSEYFVGKLRSHQGRQQRLASFTPGASARDKPADVKRRVRHPETGRLVWPVWTDVATR